MISYYSGCQKNVPLFERFFLQPLIPTFGISELIFEKRYKNGGGDPMTTESLKQRLAAPRNLRRAMFYFRLSIVFAIVVIIAFWLDFWIRGELGMSKKIVMFAQGEWGRGVSWKGFLLTIILAVSPVPILAYLGIIQLEALLGV